MRFIVMVLSIVIGLGIGWVWTAARLAPREQREAAVDRAWID